MSQAQTINSFSDIKQLLRPMDLSQNYSSMDQAKSEIGKVTSALKIDALRLDNVIVKLVNFFYNGGDYNVDIISRLATQVYERVGQSDNARLVAFLANCIPHEVTETKRRDYNDKTKNGKPKTKTMYKFGPKKKGAQYDKAFSEALEFLTANPNFSKWKKPSSKVSDFNPYATVSDVRKAIDRSIRELKKAGDTAAAEWWEGIRNRVDHEAFRNALAVDLRRKQREDENEIGKDGVVTA